MTEARFYDGKTAASRSASVNVVGEQIEILLLDTQETLFIPLNELQVAHGKDLIVVSFDDRALELWPQDWKSLGVKKDSTKKAGAVVILLPLAIGIAVTLFYFHTPIVRAIAQLLPESFLDHTSMGIVTGLEQDKCSKADPAMMEILGRLGENYSEYKVLVIKNSTVNAFALPGKVIIITSELISFVDSPEALAGIVAHEIIHVRERHVNRQYVSQILVDSFWTITLGQGIGVPLNQLAKGYFSQGEEREADKLAAQMLKEQNISPDGIRQFFLDLQNKETDLEKYLGFSHPAYPERVKVFSEKYETNPVLGPELWKELREACTVK